MRIGELANKTSCNVQTIRYYEREGVLSHPARTASGYRDYATRHLEQLNFVRHCRSLGISLDEIKLLLSFRHDPSLACGPVDDLIDGHIHRVKVQIASLRALEKQLQNLRQLCSSKRSTGECGIMNTLVQAAEGAPCKCHPGEED